MASGLQSHGHQTAKTAHSTHKRAFGNCLLLQDSERNDSLWHVSVPHRWPSLSRVPTSYKIQPQRGVKPFSWVPLLPRRMWSPERLKDSPCGTGLWPSSAYETLKRITMKPQPGRNTFLVTVLQKAWASRRFQHIGTLLLGRHPRPIHSRTAGFHGCWIFSLLGPVGRCKLWEFCGSRGVLGEDQRKQSLSHLPAFCTRPKGACVLPWLF